MRLPSNSVSPATVIRIGQDHLDRMAPVSELAPLVARFQPVQGAFVTAAEAWRSALGAVRSAQTHRDEMCTALEGAVRIVFTAVHNMTRRRRKPGLTNQYFSDGLQPFLKKNGSLIKNAGVLLAMLSQESEPGLRALIDPLSTALNTATEATANLANCRTAARAARGVLLIERQRWDTEYRHDFYDLSLRYARVAGRAESFFWRPAPGTPQEAAPESAAGEPLAVTSGQESAETETTPVVSVKAA